MKRILRKTVALMLCLMTMLSSMVFSTSAAVYESDNFTYQDFGDGVIINSYEGSDSSLVIPAELKGEKVVAISKQAFMGNTNLVSVVIPDTVTSIGEEAFMDCEKLYNIELPSTLNVIRAGAFYNTAYYNAKSSWVDDALYIDNYLIKHKGMEEKDFAVKDGTLGIAGRAFIYNEFAGIKLPDSLKFIGAEAFMNCEQLKYISIPGSVKSIGSDAFSGCIGLQKVHISKGVESIGSYAFWNCSSLVSADIPETVTNIGNGCFMHCTSLESVVVDPENTKYKSSEGVLYEGSKLLIYPCNKPESEYSIVNGITSVDYYSFVNVKNLEVLNIPASCVDIHMYAFAITSSLREINVAAENEKYYSVDGVLYVKDPDGIVLYPVEKTGNSYKTPDNIQRVFGGAFLANPYLEEITISEGVTFCGTIDYTPNLKVINLPESLEYINNESFRNCESLEAINYAGTEAQWNKLIEASGLKVNVTVNFGDGTSIKPSESITTEATIGTLPDFSFTTVASTTATDPVESTTEVTTITTAPVESTTVVTTITTDPAEITTASVATISTSTTESTAEKITTLATEPVESTAEKFTTTTTQQQTTPATEYVHPDFDFIVVDGGIELTNYKSQNKDVVIPEEINGITVFSIGYDTFKGNKNIESVIMPDTITKISDSTFEGCENLKSCKLSESLKNISYFMFMDCTSLESIVVPDSVKRIGIRAFKNCTKLNDVTLPENLEHIGENILTDTAYARDEANWSGSVLYYGTYALGSGIYIKNGKIKEGTTLIAGFAFYKQSKMTSIALPESLEYICDGAFKECTSLKNVTVPNGVKVLEEKAFFSCDSLESIILPDSLTYIDYMAFYDCVNLKTINLPKSLEEAKGQIFGGCTNLSAVYVDDANPLFFDDNGVLYKRLSAGGVMLLCYPVAKEGDSYTVLKDTTRIEPYSFEDTRFIKEVYASEAVYYISNEIAVGSESLEAIHIPEANEKYCSVDGVVFTKDGKELMVYPQGKKDKSYTIPEGTEELFTYVFFGCTYLEELVFAKSITDINASLRQCPAFTTLRIPYKPEILKTYVADRCPEFCAIYFDGTMAEFESYGRGYTTQSDKGLYAYCSDGTIELVARKAITGDVNLDGKLNIRDATLIQKHLAKIVVLDMDQLFLADTDDNGKINIKDATAIQKKIANLI